MNGFFEEQIDEDERILVWSLAADNSVKSSVWCRSPEEAARAATRFQGNHVYFGPAIFRDGLGVHEKGGAADVVGVTSLFVDIDFAHEGKAKPYPPDIDAAYSILDAGPFYPSVVWHTGGGIQAAWFLKEVEYLADTDRSRVAGITKGWVGVLRGHAKALGGWELDSVGNLDRVLRLPGSMNVKAIYGTPRPVTVLEFNPDRRYLLEDFEPFVGVAPVDPEEIRRPSGIVLSRTPQPPHEMFEVLLELHPKFRATWLMHRPDFADQSMSTYDMSLATIALRNGFTDQETADLLVKFRLEKGSPKDVKKAFRLDYIERTIHNARRGLGGDANA